MAAIILQPTINPSKLPYKNRGVFSSESSGLSPWAVFSSPEGNVTYIGTCDLPDMYALSSWACRPQALDVHIRQITDAYIETFRDDKGIVVLQSMRVAHLSVILN